MQQRFIAPLICKTFLFLVVTLLAGIALGAIPFLIARADVIEVGCNVTELINAINTANGNGKADTINLVPGCTYTLTTTNNTTDGPNGLPSITSTITINGNGATIQRDLSFTCPEVSNPEFRIFHVASGGNLTLNDVTVSNGCVWYDFSGGGVYNKGTLSVINTKILSNTCKHPGGGIYSEGTLNISYSTLSGDRAHYGGGGVSRDEGTLSINNTTISHNVATYGGGIYNNGGTATAVISNTLIYSNTAQTDGGGILNKVKLSIGNSTLSGNTADNNGGAIHSDIGTATVDISNSTICGNTAKEFFGGGIYKEFGTVNIKNSIVANNIAVVGPDCYRTLTSQDYNLIKDTSWCTIIGITTHTITDTVPSLGPLQDNGGSTWTHALLPSSPAIDHIPYETNGCGTDYTTDQRDVSRPQDGDNDGTAACDIGAYEYQPPAETPTPTSTPTDTPTPTVTPTPTDTSTPTITPTPTDTPTPTPTNTPIIVTCDVNELINTINIANGSGGADTINLAADCTYTLTTVNNDTDGPNGLPSITSEITINGNGATIERGSTDPFRIFHVDSGGNLTLNNITIASGDAGGNPGGGIYNAGTLSINNSTLSGNTGGYGGGILNSGTLSISNSTLSGNTGSFGGGICGGGTLDISNSTLSGNTATSYGGGIYSGGPVSINNSTFAANTATNGGGIYRSGGTVNVKNTILAGNTPNNCVGTMTSQGYNLESGTDCGFTGTGDLQSAAANLGPLQDNGGPTWTQALLSGSPAIDHIPYETSGCGTTYTTDQRGYIRPCPTGGGCDIGAYEGYVLFGDLDCDCDVDVEDIMLVAGRWHCQSGEGCYEERYDLDGDGDIDIVDIMLVAAHWGDVC